MANEADRQTDRIQQLKTEKELLVRVVNTGLHWSGTEASSSYVSGASKRIVEIDGLMSQILGSMVW